MRKKPYTTIVYNGVAIRVTKTKTVKKDKGRWVEVTIYCQTVK